MTKKETIADRIARLRKEKALSYAELERATGIDASTLKSAVARKSLGRDSVIKLAAFFGVTAGWLDYGDEPVAGRPGFIQVRKALLKLAAGPGSLPEEGMLEQTYRFREEWLRSIAWGKVILFEVDGQSMFPTLQNRDLVLVDLGRKEIADGEMYAFAQESIGEWVIRIKRLSRTAGLEVKIVQDSDPLNPGQASLTEIDIIGRVIWYAHSCI